MSCRVDSMSVTQCVPGAFELRKRDAPGTPLKPSVMCPTRLARHASRRVRSHCGLHRSRRHARGVTEVGPRRAAGRPQTLARGCAAGDAPKRGIFLCGVDAKCGKKGKERPMFVPVSAKPWRFDTQLHRAIPKLGAWLMQCGRVLYALSVLCLSLCRESLPLLLPLHLYLHLACIESAWVKIMHCKEGGYYQVQS